MLELTRHLIGFDWLQPGRVCFVLAESEAQPRRNAEMFYSFTCVPRSKYMWLRDTKLISGHQPDANCQSLKENTTDDKHPLARVDDH